MTPNRPRQQIENDEYGAFVRRAYGRRDGDVEALALMPGLAEEIDTAIAEAVKGLRGCGYSWAEIGSRPEVPVSLEHLRHVDPQTRILVGYRLDVTPAESSRLRRRLALPPDPRITLHFDEVVLPGTSGRFWSAMRWHTPA